MPLFQPSNITPSSFAGVGGGTIAVTDNVKITWQVNGNVAMTGYKITIYDMENNTVYSSGILTNGTPFYPTDNKGNPNYFSYEPNITWESLGLQDGKQYTLQIIQYWGNETDVNHSVTQFSQSSFLTRTFPVFKISKKNGESDFSTVKSVFQDFTASYTQAQDDSIDWVRWQFYQVGETEILLDDTSVVNTQVLSYRADNMKDGNDYKIVCTIQTENGVLAVSEKAFNVSYNFVEALGNFDFKYIDKASNYLSWEYFNVKEDEDIPGISNGNNYEFDNGSLVLPKSSTITWNTKNGNSLNIPSNWTLAWNGNIDVSKNFPKTEKELSLSGVGIEGAVFSPNGEELSLWGGARVVLCVVSKNRIYEKNTINTKSIITTVSYNNDGKQCIGGAFGATYDGEEIFTEQKVYSSAFNGDYGNVLAIGMKNRVDFFKIESGTATRNQIYPIEDIGEIISLAFTPNGGGLIVAGKNGVDYFYKDSLFSAFDYRRAGRILSSELSSGNVVFSANGEYLICGSNVYTVSYGTREIYLTILGNIGDNYNACFTADSNYIISCFLDHDSDIRMHKIEKNTITKIGGTGMLYSACNCIACNLNNNVLFAGGGISSSQAKYIFVDSLQSQMLISAGNLNIKFDSKIKVDISDYSVDFSFGIENVLVLTLLDSYIKSFSLSVNKSAISLIFDREIQTVEIDSSKISQTTIDTILLNGAQICDYLYITSGEKTIGNDYMPEWDADTQFLTNFDLNTLQAGKMSTSETMTDIYREDISTGELKKLYSCDENTTQIRDFSWLPNRKYNYYSYARSGLVYSKSRLFNKQIAYRNQPYYLLIATTQDEDQPNVYHVVYYFRFGNNINAGSVSNNNNPNFLETFTGYRLKQPVKRKGKSGTLGALLSNCENGEYIDTATQMDNLYALSNCKNPIFLKDMKGNLYMVSIAGAITQTINTKSARQEVSISIPWEEIANAENVSIIQIPTDEGWADENSKLSEVRLEVDMETGMLKVIYPSGYNNSTTFNLKTPDLYAETKNGVKEADLELVEGNVILYE